MGLDPRNPGSQPEPKADAQLLSHPGVPRDWRTKTPTHPWPQAITNQLAVTISTLWGRLGSSAVEHLPLAQVMIPESWDRVPHQAPFKEPASPSAYASASLCVSHE